MTKLYCVFQRDITNTSVQHIENVQVFKNMCISYAHIWRRKNNNKLSKLNYGFFAQDNLPNLCCFWCFNCYFSSKQFLWPNVLYMVRKRMVWGLTLCIEHSISILSQRPRIAMTQWDNFDSYTWTLVTWNSKTAFNRGWW